MSRYSPVLRKTGYLRLARKRLELLQPAYEAAAIAEEVEKEVGRLFPVSTEAAATILRRWGLDIQSQRLRYMVDSGQLPEPIESSPRRRWSLNDVDRAAEMLLQQGRLTLAGSRRMDLAIDAEDEMLAELEALHGDLASVPRDLWIQEAVPGAPGLGIPTEVRFRRMTPEEAARRETRIRKAREVCNA